MSDDKNAPNLNQQNSQQDPTGSNASFDIKDSEIDLDSGANNVPDNNLEVSGTFVESGTGVSNLTSDANSNIASVDSSQVPDVIDSSIPQSASAVESTFVDQGEGKESQSPLKGLAEKISNWGSKASKDDPAADLTSEGASLVGNSEDVENSVENSVAPPVLEDGQTFQEPSVNQFVDQSSTLGSTNNLPVINSDSVQPNQTNLGVSNEVASEVVNNEDEVPDILAQTDNSNNVNTSILEGGSSDVSRVSSDFEQSPALDVNSTVSDNGALIDNSMNATSSDVIPNDNNTFIDSSPAVAPVETVNTDSNLEGNENITSLPGSDALPTDFQPSGINSEASLTVDSASNLGNFNNSGDVNGMNANPVSDQTVDFNSANQLNNQDSEVNVVSGGFPYSIEQILQRVVEVNASDLHLSVGYPPTLRIDGVLQPLERDLIVTEDLISDLILPVLPENKKELLEVNREVDLAYELKDIARFRINAFYEQGEMSAAFRLIPSQIRSIEELKLPPVYHQFAKLNQGFVLVTGPTGHGKSTTIAAIIQEINENYGKHIITIEDPIEYIYPKSRALVAQREMHEDTHSWEIALRSAMREDPDVVLVGEMRDFETIAAAITLAETGHLVFATLHTNNAAQTIDRIIDVFPENQQAQVRTQLASTLEAVISQRLIPLPKGGRRAASEVLISTSAVKNLIREGKSFQIDNVIRTSADLGMQSMEQSLVQLVRDGEIRVEDAENYALYPDEVIRLLKRG